MHLGRTVVSCLCHTIGRAVVTVDVLSAWLSTNVMNEGVISEVLGVDPGVVISTMVTVHTVQPSPDSPHPSPQPSSAATLTFTLAPSVHSTGLSDASLLGLVLVHGSAWAVNATLTRVSSKCLP